MPRRSVLWVLLWAINKTVIERGKVKMSSNSTYHRRTRPSNSSTVLEPTSSSKASPSTKRSYGSPHASSRTRTLHNESSPVHSLSISQQEVPERMCERLKRQPPRRHNLQFNKWYIEPQLRCVQRAANLKCNYKAYNDIEYFYQNLNNTKFWNWRHPLDGSPKESRTRNKPRPSNRQMLKAKLNMKVLEGFKKNLDESRQRLPNIVKEMFSM